MCGSLLACLYNVTCLGTAAFISDLSVFEREYIKNKSSKYRGSLVSFEMGELEKRSKRKENATEPSATVTSSICVTCCKLKEPFSYMEQQLAVSLISIPDVTGMQSRMLASV